MKSEKLTEEVETVKVETPAPAPEEPVKAPKTGDEINAEQIAKAKAEGKEYQGREPGDRKLKVVEKTHGE